MPNGTWKTTVDRYGEWLDNELSLSQIGLRSRDVQATNIRYREHIRAMLGLIAQIQDDSELADVELTTWHMHLLFGIPSTKVRVEIWYESSTNTYHIDGQLGNDKVINPITLAKSEKETIAILKRDIRRLRNGSSANGRYSTER